MDKKNNKWSIEDTKKLYHVDHWSDGYFSINDQGHLTVLPTQDNEGPSIDLKDVIDEIKANNIDFPVVVRFHDILRNQVIKLNETFREVIKEAEYPGEYIGVCPVKVNQMREVVEEIVDAGSEYKFGLEAGSKAELLSVLSLNSNEGALTILNGFKDKDYLRLGLLGRKLGRKVIIVIEKFSELHDLFDLADEMKVDPIIGFRVRLSAKGTGKWADSGGDRAKFGLTIPELLQAINLLKDKGLESWVKLFHFHIGSQITDIRTIKDAVSEASRIYCQLVKLGMPLEYIDVGGGLGVDYDGTKSTANSSINYSLTDYVEDIVYILKQVCDVEGIKHPSIVSESGRAITAKHECVITKVFDQIKVLKTDYLIDSKKDEHIIVQNMRSLWDDLTDETYQEVYNDALQLKEDCINAFKLGVLTLEERGVVETIFWKICEKVNRLVKNIEYISNELEQLDYNLARQYLCNCSFFQSLPDSWAIGQLFPIIPLTRLDEKPTVPCTLADITCDSDGKIDSFVRLNPDQKTLPLHELKKDDDYYLGMFMTGAYQDVMGIMHNLFGKLNEVHIFCDDDDPTDFYIEAVLLGETCEKVLSNMQYNPASMASSIKKLLDKEVHKGNLSPKDGVRLAGFYDSSLKSYTYLKK